MMSRRARWLIGPVACVRACKREHPSPPWRPPWRASRVTGPGSIAALVRGSRFSCNPLPGFLAWAARKPAAAAGAAVAVAVMVAPPARESRESAFLDDTASSHASPSLTRQARDGEWLAGCLPFCLPPACPSGRFGDRARQPAPHLFVPVFKVR